MAIKASAQITLSHIVDIMAAYRYYLLRDSGSETPSAPNTYPPNGWSSIEPSYSEGSTNSLYFVDVTVYSDGRFEYSGVSLSSSYEAAKLAYNKAQAAQDKVDSIKVVGRNLIIYKTITARNANYSLSASADSTEGRIASDLYQYFFSVENTRGMFKPGEQYTVSNKEIGQALGLTSNMYVNVRLWDVQNNANVYGPKSVRSGESLTFTVPDDTIPENTVLYIYPASSTAVPFDITNLKMEIGTTATEWSVAPEDVDGAIADANESASGAKEQARKIEASVEVLAGTINNLVRRPDGGSLMQQDENGLYFIFNVSSLEQAMADSSDKLTELEGIVTDDKGRIDVLNSSMDALGKLTEYIRSYVNDKDQPCLELGEGDSDFKVLITNKQIQFKEGSDTPAYIGNKKLNIETAQVKGEFQIGDDEDESQEGVFVWKVRANGNMGLTWRPKELVVNETGVDS